MKRNMRPLLMTVVLSAVIWVLTAPNASAQETMPPDTVEDKSIKERYTRADILQMSTEELLEFSLEELIELQELMGVSSMEELINLIESTTSKDQQASLKDAPGVISIITAREIEQFGAVNLRDVLDRVTSMYFATSYFGRHTPSLRGDQVAASSGHILVLLNGRPMRENLYVGYDSPIYGAFPLAAVDKIEIIRGPGSVLYGTSAYSGVINIVTDEVNPEEPELTISGQGGSFETMQTNVGGSGQFGDLKVNGGLSVTRRPGWEAEFSDVNDTNFVTDNTGVITDTVYDPESFAWEEFSTSAHVALEYKGFTFSGLYTDWDVNGIGTSANYDRFTPVNTERWFADFGYRGTLLTSEEDSRELLSMAANVTYSRYYGEYDFNPGDPFTEESNDLVSELTFYANPLDSLNIIFGGLINNRFGYQNAPNAFTVPGAFSIEQTVPDYNELWWSAYAQAEYRANFFPMVKLIGGLQANKIPNVELDIVPRFGLIYNFSEHFDWIDDAGIKLLYGEAFRAPSAFENFLDALPLGLQGTRDLQPETITTIDAELFYIARKYQLSLVGFVSEQRNIIARLANDRGINVYFNAEDFSTAGLEVEFRYIPVENLFLVGSITYQANEYTITVPSMVDGTDSTENTISNSRTPVPNLMARFGLNYDFNFGVSVGIFNIYYGEHDSDDISRIPSAGNRQVVNPPQESMLQTNINVNFDLKNLFRLPELPNVILTLRAENIFDNEYYNIEWNNWNVNTIPNRPGRAFYGGLTIKL